MVFYPFLQNFIILHQTNKQIMLQYLFVLIGVLCSSAIFSQVDDNLNIALSGKIKSVRETIYSIPSGSKKTEGSVLSDELHIYNLLGYKTKTISYRNDTLFSYTDYLLRGDTILTESNEYNFDNSLYLSVVYTADENGFVTGAEYFRDYQKSYDDERKKIDVEYDKYYQRLFTSIDYKNDFKGYILRSEYLTETGSLYCKYLYKYDYKYNRVETKFYNNKGKLSWRKKMKYNQEGFLKESKLYESNRIARKSEFIYSTDSNGNWVERTEKRQLFDNFFAYNLNDDTIVTIRKIEYYE